MSRLFRLFFIGLIRAYQVTISPDHGIFKYKHPYGYCRHYPTCSDYTIQAIEKYGCFTGIYKGLIRIIKCNPFSSGGIDKLK